MNSNPFNFEKELTVIGIHTKSDNILNVWFCGTERVWQIMKNEFDFTYNDYKNDIYTVIDNVKMRVKATIADRNASKPGSFASSNFKISFDDGKEFNIPQRVYIDLAKLLIFK